MIYYYYKIYKNKIKFYFSFYKRQLDIYQGKFAKYDSKLDFDCKSIPKLESNTKVTQKPCEITASPL